MDPDPASGALTRRYRIFCAVMAALFALSAAVQWNDPDPLGWIAFYSLGALTAVAGLLSPRAPRALLLLEPLLAAVALGVVLAFAPALRSARIEAVTSIQMKSSADEELREFGGAAIVLGFTLVLIERRVRIARHRQRGGSA